MRLLLTGASGFLGRNVILSAPDDWRITALFHNDAGFPEFVKRMARSQVVAVRCDLADREQVAEFFEKNSRTWDCCLYLAARVDIPWSVREPHADLFLNTGSLLNLLEGISAQRFVYFSSGAVYDGLAGEVHPNAPLNPTLPYAISKLACERYVEFYQRRKRSIERSLIVRFFGAYGPYEAPHKIYSRVIRAIAFEKRDVYTIYGDGSNLIDAMYVADAVTAIQRMVVGDHWNDTVNLAGGSPIPIDTLVQEIGKILRPGGIQIEKEGVAHESNAFWGSTSEMREHYSFTPTITLAEGITRFRTFLEAYESGCGAASE